MTSTRWLVGATLLLSLATMTGSVPGQAAGLSSLDVQATSGDGAIIVWQGNATEQRAIMSAQRDPGSAFSAPQLLANGNNSPPSVAADPAGDAVATWERWEDGSYFDGHYEEPIEMSRGVFATARRTGQPFGDPTELFAAAQPREASPRISMNPSGVAQVIWWDTRGGWPKISDQQPGSPFTGAADLRCACRGPSIDGGGRANYAGYASTPSGATNAVYERDPAGSLGPAEAVPAGTAEIFSLRVAAGADGSALAVWMANEGDYGAKPVFVSRRPAPGAGFGPAVGIGSADSIDAVSIGADGRATVATDRDGAETITAVDPQMGIGQRTLPAYGISALSNAGDAVQIVSDASAASSQPLSLRLLGADATAPQTIHVADRFQDASVSFSADRNLTVAWSDTSGDQERIMAETFRPDGTALTDSTVVSSTAATPTVVPSPQTPNRHLQLMTPAGPVAVGPAGRFRLLLYCSSRPTDECRGRLVARLSGGRPAGPAVRCRIAVGAPRRVTFRLNAHSLRQLDRRRSLRIRLTDTSSGGSSWTISIRRSARRRP